MKELYELKGAGCSIREIAREVPLLPQGQALKSPEAMRPKARLRRASKLDPHTDYIDRRMGEGLETVWAAPGATRVGL